MSFDLDLKLRHQDPSPLPPRFKFEGRFYKSVFYFTLLLLQDLTRLTSLLLDGFSCLIFPEGRFKTRRPVLEISHFL